MNQDIISEIVRNLYLYSNNPMGKNRDKGDSLTAKKLLISSKRYGDIKYKIDRPLVFNVSITFEKLVHLFRSSPGSTIYWGDGTISEGESRYGNQHVYPVKDTYIIRIFDSKTSVILPAQTKDLYSVGDLTSLESMCSYIRRIRKNFASKIDTSEVEYMKSMFAFNEKLNVNVGKNWDVSKVKDMSRMFEKCGNLNKNIGWKWNTCSLSYTSHMFHRCQNLNYNIGKFWNVSSLVKADCMFSECINLNQNIGQYWNIVSLRETTLMFSECRSLKQNIGLNWDISNITHMSYMFENCHKIDKNVIKKWNKDNLDLSNK